MKHVSMLPPREPTYRLALEQRKLRWADLERRAVELALIRDAKERLRIIAGRPESTCDYPAGGQRPAKGNGWLGPWR